MILFQWYHSTLFYWYRFNDANPSVPMISSRSNDAFPLMPFQRCLSNDGNPADYFHSIRFEWKTNRIDLEMSALMHSSPVNLIMSQFVSQRRSQSASFRSINALAGNECRPFVCQRTWGSFSFFSFVQEKNSKNFLGKLSRRTKRKRARNFQEISNLEALRCSRTSPFAPTFSRVSFGWSDGIGVKVLSGSFLWSSGFIIVLSSSSFSVHHRFAIMSMKLQRAWKEWRN